MSHLPELCHLTTLSSRQAGNVVSFFSLSSADHNGKEVGNDLCRAYHGFFILVKKILCDRVLVNQEQVVAVSKCLLSSETFVVFLSLSCSRGPSKERPTCCETGGEHLATWASWELSFSWELSRAESHAEQYPGHPESLDPTSQPSQPSARNCPRC